MIARELRLPLKFVISIILSITWLKPANASLMARKVLKESPSL